MANVKLIHFVEIVVKFDAFRTNATASLWKRLKDAEEVDVAFKVVGENRFIAVVNGEADGFVTKLMKDHSADIHSICTTPVESKQNGTNISGSKKDFYYWINADVQLVSRGPPIDAYGQQGRNKIMDYDLEKFEMYLKRHFTYVLSTVGKKQWHNFLEWSSEMNTLEQFPQFEGQMEVTVKSVSRNPTDLMEESETGGPRRKVPRTTT